MFDIVSAAESLFFVFFLSFCPRRVKANRGE